MEGRVHHEVLRAIVERGAAPSRGEIAEALGAGVDEIDAALVRLSDGHGLVLHPGTRDVWIAHPFSLSPTATWVSAGGRGWWAPCLWCGLGIAALVGDVAIDTRHGGEREPARIVVAGGAIVEGAELVAHLALPPRRAWDNVVHFCAMLLPFRAAADVDAWSARHRLPRGEVVALPRLYALAQRWYGGHLAADWRKLTVDEAAAIFTAVGLTGDFWALSGSGRF